MASDDANEDAFSLSLSLYIYIYIYICLRRHETSCSISDFSRKLYSSKVEENECFWLAESLCGTLFSINPLAGKGLSSPT